MSEKKWLYRIRNVCGILGMVLPWLCLISGALVEDKIDHWWYSISVTYYITPALVGVLTAASIVLMTYDGYDLQDNLVTTFSGVAGLGVVLFPCKGYGYERIGFFQVPAGASQIVHCACAGVFFFLLAYNSTFLFTKHGETMTERKKMRNVIYRVCGIAMFVCCILLVVLQWVFDGWIVMVMEAVLLQLFGLSWLTKGGLILPDKEEDTEMTATTETAAEAEE